MVEKVLPEVQSELLGILCGELLAVCLSIAQNVQLDGRGYSFCNTHRCHPDPAKLAVDKVFGEMLMGLSLGLTSFH